MRGKPLGQSLGSKMEKKFKTETENLHESTSNTFLNNPKGLTSISLTKSIS
jgi:hypothetical protein